MMDLPQSRHLWDQRAADFRKAMLHLTEQNVSLRSALVWRRTNVLSHMAHLNVRHVAHVCSWGAGRAMSNPHLRHRRGGTEGYGTRWVLKRSGWAFQNLLSALEWHRLQSAVRLSSLLASLGDGKSRYGMRWWQSRVALFPFVPQSWQGKLSRLRMARETLSQPLPRYGLPMSITTA